jgi:NADH-quinone oxidoreductase subunit K
LLVCLFYLDDVVGFVMALMILTVAAAESSIGLAILVSYYRLRGGIGIELISTLKG